MAEPVRIIALFNLKPGVTPSAYEAWARAEDLPTVNALDSIAGFTVHRVTGLLGGGAAPYAYAEVIDVADMAAFGRDVAGEAMQAISAAFNEMVDVTFMVTEPVR